MTLSPEASQVAGQAVHDLMLELSKERRGIQVVHEALEKLKELRAPRNRGYLGCTCRLDDFERWLEAEFHDVEAALKSMQDLQLRNPSMLANEAADGCPGPR